MTPVSAGIAGAARAGRRRHAAELLALLLAVAVFYAGVHFGSTTAGGADSYGYVSEAGLWRSGHLTIQQNIVRESPWPNAADTWAPLGYRASPHERDAIVPLYSPGLPILMAAAQWLGGFCAAFLVVPLCGALTVWLTFVLAQKVFDRSLISIASALLVATSPIFVYQLMNPMTDIPVTCAWTASALAAASGWPALAGIMAGIGILIRPNLAAVALALLAWLVAARGRPLRFVAAAAPFAAAVAFINGSIYESPLISGYGTLGELYAWSHFATNVRQFASWAFDTQTPAFLLSALFFVAPRFYPETLVPYPRLLLGGVAAAVMLSYVFYQPYDAWWYLRFLLPAWPIVMLLTAGAVHVIAQRIGRPPVGLFLVVTAVLAAFGIEAATARFAFDVGRAERRYIDVARFIDTHTEKTAVILALQHSGTLRMYAGRLTLRFDQLDPAWLDRAVAFLEQRGRHPFIVLEGGEAARFRERFGAASEIGRLESTPVASLASADVVVYDALDRRRSDPPLAIAAAASRRVGWRCDRPYAWPTPLRTE